MRLVVQRRGGTLGLRWRFATFSENVSTRMVGPLDGPMWSLAVEVEFYALLPLRALQGVAAASDLWLALAAGRRTVAV